MPALLEEKEEEKILPVLLGEEEEGEEILSAVVVEEEELHVGVSVAGGGVLYLESLIGALVDWLG